MKKTHPRKNMWPLFYKIVGFIKIQYGILYISHNVVKSLLTSDGQTVSITLRGCNPSIKLRINITSCVQFCT